MSTDQLVNGYYPLDYFLLSGTDRIKFPDAGWWSSKQRYATVEAGTTNTYRKGGNATSEILELDLGRTRPINHIGGDVLRVPLDVTVEYDAVSASDGSHQWVPVKGLNGMAFVDRVHYDANNRNAWLASEWYFTDALGNMVATRYLRITFTRRDVTWPTNRSDPFPYPVAVKHLRVGRYVLNYQDTIGTLFNVGADASQEYQFEDNGGSVGKEIRQQFQLPADTIRMNGSANSIIPSLLGVGFLVDVAQTFDNPLLDDNPNALDVSYGWEVWDVTDITSQMKLRWGTTTVAPNMDGRAWIDAYWIANPITLVAADVDPITQRQFELRISCQNLNGSEGLYLVSPSAVPGAYSASFPGAIDGGLGNASLCMRLWADVGEVGRDVLGNSYRYASYRNTADQTGTDEPGWMSAPRPSADAVEALYFDVRTLDDAGGLSPTVVDAVRVAPRTPGVHMHIYWTNQHGQGDPPQTPEEFDLLTWTPVQQTFILRRDDTYTLPAPVHATFIKLEFTALRPSDTNLPSRPKLPPVTYRRYPTWVELQFSPTTFGLPGTGLRAAVQHFWQDAKPVERRILEEIRKRGEGAEFEFQYKLREYLMALSLGKLDKDDRKAGVAAGLIDPKSQTFIDPITASKIQLDDRGSFKQTLTVSVNHDSLLGQTVQSRFDPIVAGESNELAPRFFTRDGVSNVSTINNRITESYSNLAQTPMWFNRVCRHIYKYEKSEFNLKAYYVGVKRVEFFRQDYTIARDDPFIFDNLADDTMLEENNFEVQQTSRIQLYRDVALTLPTMLDVTYTVAGFTATDTVQASDTPTLLPSLAGGVATDVKVTDHYSGTVYYAGDDYDLHLGTDDRGDTVNFIGRSQLPSRLVVPVVAVNYIDAGVAVGKAQPSAVEVYTKAH